jgi:hypothetical protein
MATTDRIAQPNLTVKLKPLILPIGGVRGFSCLNCPKCLFEAKTLDKYLLECPDNLDTLDSLDTIDTLDRMDNYLFIKDNCNG